MSTTAKSKGGQKSWTNDLQKQWLTERVPAYLAAKGNNSTSDFWADLYMDWFKTWPLGELNGEDTEPGLRDEEGVKLRKQVREMGIS